MFWSAGPLSDRYRCVESPALLLVSGSQVLFDSADLVRWALTEW